MLGINHKCLYKKTRFCCSRAAAAILDTAQKVRLALNGSQAAQDKAREAIDRADSDIQNAKKDLTQVDMMLLLLYCTVWYTTR